MAEEKSRKMSDEMLKAAADLIVQFNGLGFVLMVFPQGARGPGNFISNVSSPDMVNALRIAANSLEEATPPGNNTPVNGG